MLALVLGLALALGWVFDEELLDGTRPGSRPRPGDRSEDELGPEDYGC